MDDGSEDEAGLWAKSLTGDGDAFGALYELHKDRIFRHSFRLVGDRHDAEDVTAATFLELWRRRRDVRLVNDSVAAWLVTTATNSSRNVQRSIRRHRRLIDSLPRAAHAPDSESEALANNPLEAVDPRLAAALRHLPALDLQLFALVALEGYSQADAAQATGLTSSAVKARLHRARHSLRSTLGTDAARLFSLERRTS